MAQLEIIKSKTSQYRKEKAKSKNRLTVKTIFNFQILYLSTRFSLQAKLAKEEKEIAEYRERKQKEEDDRQREEAERKVKEEEKERLQREQQMLLQQEKEEKQLSEKLEKEAKLEKEQSSPKREFLTPKSSPDESAKMAAFLAKVSYITRWI